MFSSYFYCGGRLITQHAFQAASGGFKQQAFSPHSVFLILLLVRFAQQFKFITFVIQRRDNKERNDRIKFLTSENALMIF